MLLLLLSNPGIVFTRASFWIKSGAISLTERAEPWTYISGLCVRSWERQGIILKLFAVWGIK